jgi:opacity protein-like surface antigen
MNVLYIVKKSGWLAAAMLLGLTLTSTGRADENNLGDKFFSIGPRASFFKFKNADEGKWYGGAQARFKLLPALAAEGSIDYYRQTYANDTEVKSYPVQASLLAYLTPNYPVSPFILGGAGWYFTRIENDTVNFEDTQNRFGLHAGGGLEAKLNEWMSLDGSYRYIWLEDLKTHDSNALEKKYEDSGYMVTAALNFHF